MFWPSQSTPFLPLLCENDFNYPANFNWINWIINWQLIDYLFTSPVVIRSLFSLSSFSIRTLQDMRASHLMRAAAKFKLLKSPQVGKHRSATTCCARRRPTRSSSCRGSTASIAKLWVSICNLVHEELLADADVQHCFEMIPRVNNIVKWLFPFLCRLRGCFWCYRKTL